MFSNVGGKIKSVVKGRFTTGVILVSILGLLIGIALAATISLQGNTIIGVVIGLVVAALIIWNGVYMFWISSLKDYAYGQIVENTDIIKAQLDILTRGDKIAAAHTTTPKTERWQPAMLQSDTWNCPYCDASNKNGQFCTSCGKRREKV